MKWDFRHELTLEAFSNYENITLTNVYFQKEQIEKANIRFENFREVCFQNSKFEHVVFDFKLVAFNTPNFSS